MSFLGGAECSTAANPLSQFSKHVQDDKSLQHDRLVGRGPNGSLGAFRSQSHATPQDELVNGFLHQNPGLPEMPLEQQVPGPMGHVHIDPNHSVHLRAKSVSPHQWAGDFQNSQAAMEAAFNAPPGTHFSADEFAKFQQMGAPGASSSHSTPIPTAMGATQRPMMGGGMMGMGMNYGMMSRPMFQPMTGMYGPQTQVPRPQQQEPEGKGKGKVVELDDSKWEEQFAEMELHEQQLRETDEAKAMEPELNQMDEELLHNHEHESETLYGDLESIWRGIQAEKDALKDLDEEEDFAKFDSSNFGPDSLNDWGLINGRIGADPIIQDYLFEDENLFQNHPNPFEEGVRIMSEGGNLSLAALAFEAAVQKDRDHVDAWVYLGSAQAQNEKEEAAIRAFEHAMKLDPNNLTALLGLAVSYTNEGYDSTAYRTLERWLSVKYPQIIAPQDLSSAADLGFTDRAQLHERVTNLFLDAARLAPDGDHMDPDVQVGLGVLFYGAEDYDKAVDCFQSALHSSELGATNQREQVHLLWNRLGATLANSGRSEEAIAAYEKALAIHPNFVRARYNLGVSCINIGCHAEAAGHLLAALDMHKSVETSGREKARELLGGDGTSDARIEAMTTQNRSTTLYDTLRRVFTQMGRRDLAEKVVVGVDPDIFRGEFDF
ncbi:peroxisomal targeting signal 1 receptor encoded by the pex5 protein [Echria macrotheca]|uniref:Peroxisomal targeting signal receptor n=1 Tax=Echria macrotheca TaxID=438768 RepID=A0AAJ0BGC3_9PEZI|nr:peroxisomal targeting signal 1 receptor encoded by the pex5 protein [Echria macrotheca]